MIVKHNITAMNSNRMLGLTTSSQAKSTEKLSSGYKINRAADDAAGLAISEKMRRQVRGLTQASANAQDGISAVQTAEGALTEVHDMLQRMNELAVKAGNGTMSESDRQSVQDEIDQLITEIDRVSETTKFNETYLLKGQGKSGSSSPADAGVSVKDGATRDAKLIAATGNIYTGTFTTAATDLAEGTKTTATVTYLDANGKKREREVDFEVGKDAETTAANFAEAIGKDDELKKIFKATSDADGGLKVESKLNGNKTDDTKNKVEKVEFKLFAGATRKVSYTEGGTVAAKQDGYEIMLGTASESGVAGVASAAKAFADGSSITIDGKTYTYDSGATTANSENVFKTLKDLQELLGDDYDVQAFASGLDSATGKMISGLVSKDAANGTYSASAMDAYTSAAFTASSTGTWANIKAGTAGFGLMITRKADTSVEDTLNFSLQVGADTTQENKIDVDIVSMSAKSLGIDGLSVTGKDSTNADAAVNTIADAIAKVSKQRSALGAVQNRLEHTINNLDNVVENTQSAEAAIRDTDIAEEMVKYSNNNILQQAGTSMLSQANQSNQLALSLLG